MSKHETKRSETQLIGECRIAFPNHFEKRTKTAGGMVLTTPRFDAVLLVPKLGPAESCPNYAKLSAMAMEAATKAWNGWPDGGVWPIDDGDIPYKSKPKPGETPLTPEQIAERNKWRVGSWTVEVTHYLPQGPKVTILSNGAMQDIPAQTVNKVQLYKSGDHGYVSMSSFTYHHESGKFGVNFSYEGVAYTRPGELIGGGPKSSAQMFAGIPVSASAPSPGVPGASRPPGPPALPTSAGAAGSSAPASYAPPPAAPVASAPSMGASLAPAGPPPIPTTTSHSSPPLAPIAPPPGLPLPAPPPR